MTTGVALVCVSTAGKALGVSGAFVTGPEWAIDYLVQKARPFIFSTAPPPAGSKQLLTELGPEGFARWLRESAAVGVTETTFRDAHQSLLATRLRTTGLLYVAPYIARLTPQLLSIEAWGGATYDVALRFDQVKGIFDITLDGQTLLAGAEFPDTYPRREVHPIDFRQFTPVDLATLCHLPAALVEEAAQATGSAAPADALEGDAEGTGDLSAEARQFVAQGVDGIFTDFPDVVVAAIKATR
jgi:hypothetical protein